MISKENTHVAIVGGGPGGLATAIALSELPFISVKLYEQNPEPREAGAGISLSTNAWRILDILGASDLVKGGSKKDTHQRNAYTGKILTVVKHPESSDLDTRGAIRARRTRLQSALLSRVPEGIIQFNKKVVTIENIPDGGVRLLFQDQTEATADLVIGGDGIKSRIRQALFPDHHIRFTGNTAWRTLVPKSALSHLPDITHATAWWWGKDGHAYFSDVDDDSETDDPYFEITLRSYHEPEIPGKTVVWGISASNERVRSRYTEFDRRIRDAIDVVPEGQWREFALFAGPRLVTITGWDKVALIGDASHPLSGAFGSGATFAMEDGWILARALEHVAGSPDQVREALRIFNEIRTPYYTRMYQNLDESGIRIKKATAEAKDFDEILRARIDNFLYGDKDFIYKNDIRKVWQDFVAADQERAKIDSNNNVNASKGQVGTS